jgi:hypothetical protein
MTLRQIAMIQDAYLAQRIPKITITAVNGAPTSMPHSNASLYSQTGRGSAAAASTAFAYADRVSVR